ncbi:hypoxia inducible factor 1 subunit alpha, like 2 isoform X2 [Conger conger]|uniref:hypoxia inducible factor 1 subunit alpha, like 2 isoform X2 n=1 Tax=Conger conger TaxID=82655 RepID=UPI002A5A99D6|nr:hypoxia inducible factor 1 subunit alpha, like 2 isoform X2 [Conger conger]
MVCSEWRKARSRAAAQSRREQEGGLFGELLRRLPLPPTVLAHLDKASVIRLTLSYLRLRALLGTPDCALNTTHCTLERSHPATLQSDTAVQGCEFDGMSRVKMMLDAAFEGFLLLLSRDGKVIYTTEAISMYAGIKQVDLIGQSLYDFMHPCDQQEAREILSSKSDVEDCQKCDLFFRMRSTQRRNLNLNSATWKVMHCTGVRKPSVPTGQGCLVLLCQSLPVSVSSAWDTNLNCSAFLSKHSPDMRFTYCQPSVKRPSPTSLSDHWCWVPFRVFQLTGYTETDLLGHSVYQYYHASDCQHVHQAHLSLFSKGQTSTGKYRLLVKHGGYVWVETVATVVYNSRTGQLQSVVCINYILSAVEQSGVMFSLEQMECLLKPLSCSPIPGSPLLLQGAALLGQLSQQAAVPADSCDNATPGESAWARGYEGPPSGRNENDGFTCHDTGERSEDVPLIETLLEWKSEGQVQLSPQDLETLAPYIPMDGEDFLLSPISDMEAVQLEGQGLSYAFPLTFPNLEIQSPTSPSHTWAPLTPTMTPQTPLSYYSLSTSNHACTLMTDHGGDSGRGCRLRPGQKWRPALKKYRHCPSPWPPQHTAPPWKKWRMVDSCYSTNRTSCWWSPDGLVCRCESVPWDPGYTDFSINSRNRHHPIRDPHRTVLVRRGSVLPVLSRWECEVNAPLEPSSCLLRGSEILSVLDQAMSQLPP